MLKRKLAKPIDRLRTRAGLSALRAAVLRDKLKAAEAAAQQDQFALDAEEARRASGLRGAALGRFRREAMRAMEREGGR